MGGTLEMRGMPEMGALLFSELPPARRAGRETSSRTTETHKIFFVGQNFREKNKDANLLPYNSRVSALVKGTGGRPP
jgi:hypothetical protein